MAENTCPQCGAPIDQSTMTCTFCGYNASTSTQQSQPTWQTSQPAQQYVQNDYSQPAQPVYQQGQPAYQQPDQSTYQQQLPPVRTGGLWALAIVALLFSWIFGFAAIANITSIKKCTTIEQQNKKIKNAKICSIIGIVVGIVVLFIRASAGI